MNLKKLLNSMRHLVSLNIPLSWWVGSYNSEANFSVVIHVQSLFLKLKYITCTGGYGLKKFTFIPLNIVVQLYFWPCFTFFSPDIILWYFHLSQSTCWKPTSCHFIFSWVALMLFLRILTQPVVLTNETNSGLAGNVSSLASKPQFAYNINFTKL